MLILKISKQELLKLVLEATTNEIEIPIDWYKLTDTDKSNLKLRFELESILQERETTSELSSKSILQENETESECRVEKESPYENTEDDYFSNYPVRDKKYLEVLKGKIDYVQYLKEKDEKYYYLTKTIQILNKVVGFKVLPKISYEKYKELGDVYNITQYYSNYAKKQEKVPYDVPWELKLKIRPIKDTYKNVYDIHGYNPEKLHGDELVESYCKFESSFTNKETFASTLIIMGMFLTPEQMLAAFIRPSRLFNPKCKAPIQEPKLEARTKKLTTANILSDFEYNLINLENNIRTSIEYLDTTNTSDAECDVLEKILELVILAYKQYKDKQFIELIIPDFSNKLNTFREFKNRRKCDLIDKFKII